MPERLRSALHSWRDYAVLLAGAIIMGVVVACFALATDKAQEIFFSVFRQMKLLPLLISPMTFAVSVWLLVRYFPAASGSGVPQVIVAQHLSSQASRDHLLGLPVIAAKILLVMLVLLGGASLGREGPSVQIGAAIMLFFANATSTHDKSTLIRAGGRAWHCQRRRDIRQRL